MTGTFQMWDNEDMMRNGTYILLAAVVAAGLAVSGVSACACTDAAACCGAACADGTHRDSGPVEETACCGGSHGACALPDATADKNGADGGPRDIPCSCRMSRRDPVLRKTSPSSDNDGLLAAESGADPARPALCGETPAASLRGHSATRALHVRLCVWTC